MNDTLLDSGCFYLGTDNLETAFWLVLVVGTSLCILGLFENIFISYLFLTRKKFANSPLFYLTILAVMDTFLCADWILVQSVQVYFDYTQSVWLYYVWLSYVRVLYAAGMLCIVSCVYLIIFALFETYLETCLNNGSLQKLLNLMSSNRGLVTVGALVIPFTLHSSRYFEIAVQEHENCTGFTKYSLLPLPVFQDEFWNIIWIFYLRNIFDTLVPFFLLLFMNASIIVTVRKNHISGHINMKNATRTLVADVLEYLITNVLSVLLTIWETIDLEGLATYHHDFYYNVNDAVNLMTVLSRILRLPIYCFCNEDVRMETTQIMKNIWRQLTCRKKHGNKRTGRDVNNGEIVRLVNSGLPQIETNGSAHSVQILKNYGANFDNDNSYYSYNPWTDENMEFLCEPCTNN